MSKEELPDLNECSFCGAVPQFFKVEGLGPDDWQLWHDCGMTPTTKAAAAAEWNRRGATQRAADLESKHAAEIVEAENEVWDMVIQACHDAWPEDKKVFYNESPTELITDIINERDEALKRAAGLEKDAARTQLPEEPDEDMLIAGNSAGLDINNLLSDEIFSTERAIYKAMRAAFLERKKNEQ